MHFGAKALSCFVPHVTIAPKHFLVWVMIDVARSFGDRKLVPR
jgi:hypothetical protein